MQACTNTDIHFFASHKKNESWKIIIIINFLFFRKNESLTVSRTHNMTGKNNRLYVGWGEGEEGGEINNHRSRQTIEQLIAFSTLSNDISYIRFIPRKNWFFIVCFFWKLNLMLIVNLPSSHYFYSLSLTLFLLNNNHFLSSH